LRREFSIYARSSDSGYTDKALQAWAKRIGAWHRGTEPADARKVLSRKSRVERGRDVFCFFDNTDVKLRAPFDAQTLAEKLGVARTVPVNPAAMSSR
jgi:uncharacterized protein YecE (DUF72 family)